METVTMDLNKYREMTHELERLQKMESEQKFNEVRIHTHFYNHTPMGREFDKVVYTNNPDKELQESVKSTDKAMTDIIERYNLNSARNQETLDNIDKLEKENIKIRKELVIYSIIAVLAGLIAGIIGSDLI